MEKTVLVVGAGFAGSIMARSIAEEGHKAVIIDKRDHIAGNAFDRKNLYGVNVHQYGPHYFRTNSQEIFNYLSQFTKWQPHRYKVKAKMNGELYSFPVNLTTYEQLTGMPQTEGSWAQYLEQVRHKIQSPKNSYEAVVSKIGDALYEQFFKSYTEKQWGMSAEELEPSVCSRIPIRMDRNDDYLTDKIQALPRNGYFAMFQNMLDHPNIKIILRTPFLKSLAKDFDHVIYTGPIDEYHEFKYGQLPYRSLRFDHGYGSMMYFQPCEQVNYVTSDVPYTRTVEYKHLSLITHHHRSEVVYEYPEKHVWGTNDPYYPIPSSANHELYRKYAEEPVKDVTFVGRLAQYQYYNMDQVVGAALTRFKSSVLPVLRG